MALLFMEGFESYGNLVSTANLGKWVSGSSTNATNVLARTGTLSLRMSSGLSNTTKVLTTSGGIVFGVAIQNTAAFSAADLIQVLEGSIVHLAIGVTAGGLLTVKRGSTVLATGATVLAINSWYYIELKGTIHDTTGSYELRINGVTELTATNVDTQNAGTGVWDRVQITNVCTTGNTYFDDVYVCDTSGSAPRNTFLGLVKVETLFPQTDAVAAGSNAGLTCSTGTDHGALVDEAAANTSDYNSSATVGAKDTYNYPPMTLTGTVYGIQTNLYCSKTDASARQVCAVIRSGGADHDGANVSPLTSFSYLSEIRPLDPNGNIEWTTTSIASIQAGMKVTV